MRHFAFGNHILVKETNPENVTEGGIVLPDGPEQADSMRCEVVSVSGKLQNRFKQEGVEPLKEGDIIYKDMFIGKQITTRQREKLWAIQIDHVLAVEVTD